LRYKLKVDSKGRILLPREVRSELGDVVILERTEGGFVLRRGRSISFLEEFREVITSEPSRTGKPENCPLENEGNMGDFLVDHRIRYKHIMLFSRSSISRARKT